MGKRTQLGGAGGSRGDALPDDSVGDSPRGFYLRTVDKNVVLDIDRVSELIRKRQLYVLDTYENVKDRFNSYGYNPEKPREEHLKESDHIVAALRYAIYNHALKSMKIPRPKTALVWPFPGMAA